MRIPQTLFHKPSSHVDEVISYALESCNILEKSKVIIIGDREHDIIGAKKSDIHSIGVLF